MQEGNFLRFIPPKLSGGEIGNKSRYMLVVEYNKKIEIIKGGFFHGKEEKNGCRKSIYKSNGRNFSSINGA